MTMILSAIVPPHVIQVSDRRLTRVTNGSYSVVTDDACKTVQFYNRMVFSYTGLAVIGPQSTDMWLVDRLTGYAADELDKAVHDMADEATRAFRSMSHVQQQAKGQIFIGAGWERGADGATCGVRYEVTNRWSQDGTVLPEPADEFIVRAFHYPPGKGNWRQYGSGRLSVADEKRLHRCVKNFLRRQRDGRPYIEEVVRGMRRVADGTAGMGAGTVGKDLLVAYLPRGFAFDPDAFCCQPAGRQFLISAPGMKKERFEELMLALSRADGKIGVPVGLYLPDKVTIADAGNPKKAPVRYFPHIVCKSMQVTGIKVSFQPPGKAGP